MQKHLLRLGGTTVALLTAATLDACELCAIYRAAYGSGFTFTTAAQFMPYRTGQFNGEEFPRANPDYLDRWMFHFVGGWNVTEKLGISLNIPLVHQSYQRVGIDDLTRPQTIRAEETGLGDISLIGRYQVWQSTGMTLGGSINLLAGLKLPSGDTAHLDEQARQLRIYEGIVGPGHNHDALGPVTSGVHAHDLALGSGSVDGVLGLTANAHWQRAFLNAQFQYYPRMEGAGDYQYADELMVSGGPGVFLWLRPNSTISLELNASYDTAGRDRLGGRLSEHTGMTAWYLRPRLAFTWKSRFSAQLGIDLPVRIANRGFQSVPDYRLTSGITWHF